MRGGIDGRVAVVTGATSGLGLATARALAAAGAKVIACGRDQGRLAELAPHVDLALTMDVTDAGSVEIAAASALDRHGGVDVVVNNAGVGLFAGWDETSEADLRRILEVDFLGAVRVATAFLPSLEERRGVLVQVASVAGLRGYPRLTAYSAAKHALVGWSEALRQELRGAHVVLVCPPAVDTPFFANAGWPRFWEDHPGLRPVSPETVADAIVHAIRTRPRRVIPSARARALYAASVLVPGLLERFRR